MYVDIPWMLVVDDFRQGLLITGLFLFWIVFVGEHSVVRRGLISCVYLGLLAKGAESFNP